MLQNENIILEPADEFNVDLLVMWTLDPTAQGPYKETPQMEVQELHNLILHSPDRWYFLIRRSADGEPLGRFYYRAWQFSHNHNLIDWELNIFIARPDERNRGYGASVQKLASDYLLQRPETWSVFAYTYAANKAERRALEKAGFVEIGQLPHSYYRTPLPPEKAALYVRHSSL